MGRGGGMGAGVRAELRGGGPWRRGSKLQAGGTVSPEANSLSARQCGLPLQHCREQGPGLGAEALASWQGLRPVSYPLSQLWLHRAM